MRRLSFRDGDEACEFCGNVEYDISETIITCTRCRATYGRVNGVFVVDSQPQKVISGLLTRDEQARKLAAEWGEWVKWGREQREAEGAMSLTWIELKTGEHVGAIDGVEVCRVIKRCEPGSDDYALCEGRVWMAWSPLACPECAHETVEYARQVAEAAYRWTVAHPGEDNSSEAFWTEIVDKWRTE